MEKKGKRPPAPPRSPAGPVRDINEAFPRRPTARLARERLVVELLRLRSMFGEIAERYTADTEARIAALIETARSGKVPAARITELLETVWDLQVKPRKGRRKDLARVERAVDAIEKALSP